MPNKNNYSLDKTETMGSKTTSKYSTLRQVLEGMWGLTKIRNQPQKSLFVRGFKLDLDVFY